MCTLLRIVDTGHETFGVWMEGGLPAAVTLEDAWKQNREGESCIPAGVYHCVWKDHPIHGYKYELLDVPGRTSVLIHIGNTNRDTEGCILLGTAYGYLDRPAILNSATAIREFHDRQRGMEFDLEIIDVAQR